LRCGNSLHRRLHEVACAINRSEEWKRLSEKAIEIVCTKDSGTLQYEIFFNEDESEAVVFERYRDANAAIEHFSKELLGIDGVLCE
jgi:quinol monooxygenase YgiN